MAPRHQSEPSIYTLGYSPPILDINCRMRQIRAKSVTCTQGQIAPEWYSLRIMLT